MTVRGFTVTGTDGGIYGIYEAGAFTGSTIERNFVHGFTNSLGISLAAASKNAVVRFNDVSGNYGGIYLSTGATCAQIIGNTVHDQVGSGGDAGSGIIFEGGNTNVLVSQNFIRDNAGSGIYVFGDYGNDFSGTKITSNSITGNDGAGFNNTNSSHGH